MAVQHKTWQIAWENCHPWFYQLAIPSLSRRGVGGAGGGKGRGDMVTIY